METNIRVLHWNDKILQGKYPEMTIHFLAEHAPEYLKYCVATFEDICVTQEVADSLQHHYFFEKRKLDKLPVNNEVFPPHKERKELWYRQTRFEFYNNLKLQRAGWKGNPHQIEINTAGFNQRQWNGIYNKGSYHEKVFRPVLERKYFYDMYVN